MTRRGGATEGGFVLAFVVFMLFAISVAGATGYVLVSSEFMLAQHSDDGAEALTVARAGLERYVAESLGTLADTATYALGEGVATVTPRKLYERDSLTHVYYIRSEGTVDDARTPGTPARRVVGAYATYHRRPVPHSAAVVVGNDGLRTDLGGSVTGLDQQTAGDCAGGGASPITGGIARYSVNTAGMQGSPLSRTWSGGHTDILDSMRLRWDVLTDPDFPIEFDNTLPDFGAIPADSFPVVRYTGWVYAGFSGRGTLIIDGKFDPTGSFDWEGIVLAGRSDDIIQGEIEGMLVAGFEPADTVGTVQLWMDVEYHSCNVYRANESLSYLVLMPSTVHETS